VSGPKRKPEPLGDVLAGWLEQSGLGRRVDQAGVIPEWPRLVGSQIAAVTDPQSITPGGTLFVNVKTNAWMNELSLLEPELLRSLNQKSGRPPIKRIRWQLWRPGRAP
jgi:predicted nucleic acid-binding Zn ribbon protein